MDKLQPDAHNLLPSEQLYFLSAQILKYDEMK